MTDAADPLRDGRLSSVSPMSHWLVDCHAPAGSLLLEEQYVACLEFGKQLVEESHWSVVLLEEALQRSAAYPQLLFVELGWEQEVQGQFRLTSSCSDPATRMMWTA